MVDFRKIFDASKMIIALSLIYNLALIGVSIFFSSKGHSAGFFLIPTYLPPSGTIMVLTSVLLMIISYIGNFSLFFYGGYRAAKMGYDSISCGYVGLFTYAVVGMITGILGIVIGLQNVNAIYGGYAKGIIGVAIVESIIYYLLGMAINYIISKNAGSFGGAK